MKYEELKALDDYERFLLSIALTVPGLLHGDPRKTEIAMFNFDYARFFKDQVLTMDIKFDIPKELWDACCKTFRDTDIPLMRETYKSCLVINAQDSIQWKGNLVNDFMNCEEVVTYLKTLDKDDGHSGIYWFLKHKRHMFAD